MIYHLKRTKFNYGVGRKSWGKKRKKKCKLRCVKLHRLDGMLVSRAGGRYKNLGLQLLKQGLLKEQEFL
jgi:hypothetical protein